MACRLVGEFEGVKIFFTICFFIFIIKFSWFSSHQALSHKLFIEVSFQKTTCSINRPLDPEEKKNFHDAFLPQRQHFSMQCSKVDSFQNLMRRKSCKGRNFWGSRSKRKFQFYLQIMEAVEKNGTHLWDESSQFCVSLPS